MKRTRIEKLRCDVGFAIELTHAFCTLIAYLILGGGVLELIGINLPIPDQWIGPIVYLTAYCFLGAITLDVVADIVAPWGLRSGLILFRNAEPGD